MTSNTPPAGEQGDDQAAQDEPKPKARGRFAARL
jgi:hypothetical protein